MENGTSIISKGFKDFLWRYIRKLNLKNCTVNITPATVRGDNHLGVVVKVEVKSENSNYNWILKCAIDDETFRFYFPLTHAFEREVYMYTKVLLEYERLQKEKGILSPFKSFTKLYTFSLTPPYECVVLEDLKALGYVLQDRRQPLDYNHVLMIMKEYGRFHALSFALRDQKPSVFKEIAENTKDMYYNNLHYVEPIVNAFKTVENRALNTLDPVAHKSVYKKFSQFKERVYMIIQEIIKPEASGVYSVITHGDCWTNNFLFKYSNCEYPNAPTEMCFIDWQLSRLCSPVFDLSYFLFTCTDKQFRDKYYDEMINEYYDSLSSFLLELGSDSKKLFPFSVLKDHLKLFSVFGLFMSIQSLYSSLSEHGEVPYFLKKSEEKVKQTSTHTDTYSVRIKDVILDFEKLGYNFHIM
ncbi:hypothetical protein RN001_000519 [Aquatica leii]|uniref:CHK kinase-like domain-containing protein n=1 Tax=Aquatica leii TaxID=1421715 RepID=A0AAN7SQK4_9COLE|nr:hypothetical protein RN001_000519 [Aquatica leii]